MLRSIDAKVVQEKVVQVIDVRVVRDNVALNVMLNVVLNVMLNVVISCST